MPCKYQSCISRANFGKADVHGAGRKLGLTLSDGQSLSAPAACDRYSAGQLNILKTKRSMLKIALTGQAQELFANGKLFAKPDGGISVTKPVRSRQNDVAAEKEAIMIESEAFSKFLFKVNVSLQAQQMTQPQKLLAGVNAADMAASFDIVMVTKMLLPSWPPSSMQDFVDLWTYVNKNTKSHFRINDGELAEGHTALIFFPDEFVSAAVGYFHSQGHCDTHVVKVKVSQGMFFNSKVRLHSVTQAMAWIPYYVAAEKEEVLISWLCDKILEVEALTISLSVTEADYSDLREKCAANNAARTA